MIITVNNIKKDDLQTRITWINDKRVNEFLYLNVPVSQKSTVSWFNRINECADRLDLTFKDENGCPLGMAGLTSIHTTFSNAEFYIFINPQLHGKGLGKAITSAVLDYAFFELQLYKVYLYTDAENVISIKLYEKLGFIQEGCQRKHRFKDGRFRDKLLYGILNEEWAAKREGTGLYKISFDSVLTAENKP